MKKAISIAAGWLPIFAIFYLAAGFTLADLNFFNWGFWIRGLGISAGRRRYSGVFA